MVSDLVELGRNILVQAKRPQGSPSSYRKASIERIPLKKIDEVVTPYYMRIRGLDRPGVLSKISGVLGKNDISISAVMQKGRRVKGECSVVMMTHEAKERNVHRALKEIDHLNIILGKTMLIRVENELK